MIKQPVVRQWIYDALYGWKHRRKLETFHPLHYKRRQYNTGHIPYHELLTQSLTRKTKNIELNHSSPRDTWTGKY
jgi:hypothetical protein